MTARIQIKEGKRGGEKFQNIISVAGIRKAALLEGPRKSYQLRMKRGYLAARLSGLRGET